MMWKFLISPLLEKGIIREMYLYPKKLFRICVNTFLGILKSYGIQ